MTECVDNRDGGFGMGLTPADLEDLFGKPEVPMKPGAEREVTLPLLTEEGPEDWEMLEDVPRTREGDYNLLVKGSFLEDCDLWFEMESGELEPPEGMTSADLMDAKILAVGLQGAELNSAELSGDFNPFQSLENDVFASSHAAIRRLTDRGVCSFLVIDPKTGEQIAEYSGLLAIQARYLSTPSDMASDFQRRARLAINS